MPVWWLLSLWARYLVQVWGTVQVRDIDGNTVKTSRLSTPRSGSAPTACCAVVDDAGDQGRLLKKARSAASEPQAPGSARACAVPEPGRPHLLALGDGAAHHRLMRDNSNRTPASVRVVQLIFSPDGRHIAVDYLDQAPVPRLALGVGGESASNWKARACWACNCAGRQPGGDVLLRAADGVIGEPTSRRAFKSRMRTQPDPRIRQSEDGLVGQLGHR